MAENLDTNATDVVEGVTDVVETVESTAKGLKSAFKTVTSGVTGIHTFCENTMNGFKERAEKRKEKHEERIKSMMDVLNIQDPATAAKENGVNHEFF